MKLTLELFPDLHLDELEKNPEFLENIPDADELCELIPPGRFFR